MQTYTIKALDFQECLNGDHLAHTWIAGYSYRVAPAPGPSWTWSVQAFAEAIGNCDSLALAKQLCEDHWRKRMEAGLVKVRGDDHVDLGRYLPKESK